MEMIVRGQGALVYAGGCIAHSRSVGRIHLERSVVRGDERPCAGSAEEIRNCNGQRCALLGIGGRAQFVEQYQRAGVGESRQTVKICNVRRECRERSFDGLRIADIGEKRGENRKAGPRGWHGNSSLRHHGQQRRGLERHRFAACIGAADDELAFCAGQFQNQGDDRTSGSAQAFFEKRVATTFNLQQLLSKTRRNAIEGVGEASARQQAVDKSEYACAFDKARRIATHLPREGNKDAVNLRLLVFKQPHQLVVLLDGFERLDVDRLA